MSERSVKWCAVCPLEDIVPQTGVAALLQGEQVAVFRFRDRVFAVDNRDPATGAGVLSRGLLGDRAGEPKVTSPIYKQSYSLETGRSFDDETVRIAVYLTRIREDGVIEVGLRRMS